MLFRSAVETPENPEEIPAENVAADEIEAAIEEEEELDDEILEADDAGSDETDADADDDSNADIQPTLF